MGSRKETNDSKNKEPLKKVVCFGCGQTGHMAKDKKCPKNNKDKKRTTAQIYAAREEDETEESKLYEGSQYSSEGEDMALCSPHGRKIIPHFIHSNNVK